MERDDPSASVGYARNLARKILRDADLKEPPILIKDMLKHLEAKSYNISVYAWSFDESVSGIQVAGNATSCTIGYNEDHHTHRQRFTIAHEIGHFLLGHTRETNPEKFKPTEIQEQEAHEFAGELLMPLTLLKASIANGNRSIPALARLFLVSDEAMTVRLMKTRLLNKLTK